MSTAVPASPAAQSRRRDALRMAARARRDALDPATRQAAGKAFARHAESVPPLQSAPPSTPVAVYLALPLEAPTAPLIARLRAGGATLCIPAYDPQIQDFRWALLPNRDEDLRPGRFGVSEPISPRWVDERTLRAAVIPGVAFDRRGGRLGHGAGYYDRLLARCPHAARIGLAFLCQVTEPIPLEPHDQLMDFLITELGAAPTHARPTSLSSPMNEQKP